MSHIPYGYKIIDGKAVIEEEQAAAIKKVFEEYISGKGLKAAAENAGLNILHSGAGRMLRNKHYLGDDYYPPIIEKEVFDKAEEIRRERADKLGRVRELNENVKPIVKMNFRMGTQTTVFYDSFAQAEYAYSLIESEGTQDE